MRVMVGDRVRVPTGAIGIIRDVIGDKARVQIGNTSVYHQSDALLPDDYTTIREDQLMAVLRPLVAFAASHTGDGCAPEEGRAYDAAIGSTEPEHSANLLALVVRARRLLG